MKTWKINSLDCSTIGGNQKVIRQISLSVVRSENNKTIEVQTGVALPLPKGDDFLAYESLNEATVIAWAKAALGEAKVKELEDALDAQFGPIEGADIVSTPLPWLDDSGSPTAKQGA